MRISGIRWALSGVGMVMGVACADGPSGQTPEVAFVDQALTVIDCQTAAAECLGVMPSAAGVRQCRSDFEGCLGDVAAETQTQATGLVDCRDVAVECAQNASSFGDAATCRTDFEACVAGSVSLPTLPTAPDLNVPTLPEPPTGNDALTQAADCRQTALDCVQAAGDITATAACADDFQSCIADALTSAAPGLGNGLPDLSNGLPGLGNTISGLPDLQVDSTCRDEALACVQAAAGADGVVACGQAFAECRGAAIVNLGPGNGLPDLGNGLPDLGNGLPDLGNGVSGAGCLAELNDCVLAGGDVDTCVAQARTCAGL